MKTVVLIALALALTTAACGRKGPLQPVDATPNVGAEQVAAQAPDIRLN